MLTTDFNFLKKFIYSRLRWVFVAAHGLQLRGAGATLRCGARALGARASVAVAHTGLVTPRHVGSSRTRARTRVSCISRQILNHCATREAQ